MCTVNSGSEVMVCDVSRDRVTHALRHRVGEAARAETVDGEGTRFTCVAADRVQDFQASVREALGWGEDAFAAV